MRISGILTAAVALTLWVGAPNRAHAQALSSSTLVDHIPLGTPIISPPPGVPAPVDPPGPYGYPGWSETWSAPALPAWQGTFTVTGHGTEGGGTSDYGTSTFNFSGLTVNGGDGELPVGTYVNIGDLDAGSGTEDFYITAYSSATPAPNTIITTPWLNTRPSASGARDRGLAALWRYKTCRAMIGTARF
jgi:hypothetical protein